MRLIKLTRGFLSKVDNEDYIKVSSYRWYADPAKSGRFYVSRAIYKNGKQICKIKLHRFLMNPPKGMCVDHINGDTLDNRKSNLRICTIQENFAAFRTPLKNKTSKYRGVCFYPKRRKWVSQIQFNYKRFYIGYFKTEREAAIAYDLKSKEIMKEFSQPNILK